MKLRYLMLLACLVLAVIVSLKVFLSLQNAGSASQVDLLNTVQWDWPGEDRFGGLSGLEISDDGTELVAVSDRPLLIYARLERQGDSITKIRNKQVVRPRTPGSKYYHDEVNNDTEALALGQNGRLWISTENYHDVEYFEPGEHTAHHIEYDVKNEVFMNLPYNQGLEALALDPEGRVIAIPEYWAGDTFPLFRLENGKWTISGNIEKRGSYVPVGADTGPDGHLYLLERRYLRGIGFSSRIRRFAFAEEQVVETETLLQTKFRTHGNLEGIAVWSDDSNAIRLTMVSDDNFSIFLNTEIVEYRWVAQS